MQQREALGRDLPVPGVPMILSGWSYALADLVPWSHRQLLIISALMAIFDALLLAILYRDWRLWVIQELTLLFAVGAMVASMKLLNIPLNLLNVLAFVSSWRSASITESTSCSSGKKRANSSMTSPAWSSRSCSRD